MAIDELIPSPSGELVHDDVRLKINEIIPLANGALWVRKTASYAVTERYVRLDMFPSADDQIVTLPDPSLGDYQVAIYNQTDNAAFDIIVNDFSGAEVKRIASAEAFSYFKNDSAPTGDSVQLSGVPIPNLDIVSFGNFNDLNYEKLPTGTAALTGNGSQFSNYPVEYILDPVTPYICTIETVNTPSEYNQIITFTSSFTVTDDTAIGRPAFRGSGNFGGATAEGWTPYGKLSDKYPPENTGGNVGGSGIVVFSGNVTDSVASADLTLPVIALHNNNGFYPNPIYDLGILAIDPAEVKLTNISPDPYSFEITVSGKLTSNSTSNAAVVGIRLNSTGGVGTGTDKTYPAGTTQGAATVRAGYTSIGAFTLAAGESVWVEISKSVTGTLVFDNSLIIIRPIY